MTDVLSKSRAMEAGNAVAARVILADPAKYGSDGLMVEWARKMTGQVVDYSSDPAMSGYHRQHGERAQGR